MTGGEFIVLLTLGIVAAFVAIVVGVFRLVFRVGHVGARRAWAGMANSSRSLFGPEGSPEELCKALLKKHLDLSPGVQGGLSLTCSGCRGRLDFISDRTEIRFRLDGRVKGSFQVSTATFMTQLAEDDPDAFRIRGSESLYQETFSDPELGRMLRDWRVPFEWKFGPEESLLHLRGIPRDEEELWRWLKGSYRLLQSVPGFEPELVVEDAARPSLSLANGLCQICGGSLGEGFVVVCRRCSTPHHEDCWTYAGECSTFACRERRFVRAS
ncbi:MAG: hypothetical protein HY293_07665 [Planctomycetes bacterium]|nr:hypothetical protein [Planctomycetota bacterium]